MDRWFGKVAVVTGASSGIGAAIAIDLVNAGMKVVGLARRVELVAELKNCIAKESKGKLFPLKCDVTNETEVRSIFKWIEENLGGVDVMINNAGILRKVNLVDLDNTNAIREIVDTNIMGYVYCTREAFHSMKKRNVSGHIILMNSIAGHKVIYSVGSLPSFNIYTPTKYAITAMTEILRQELIAMGTKIKITSISPGYVKTEIFPAEQLEAMKDLSALNTEDVSAAVLYVLGTPSHVQVHELIIKPVGEAF